MQPDRGITRFQMIALTLTVILTAAAMRPAPPNTGAIQADTTLFAVTFTTGQAWEAGKPPQQQAGFKEHSENLFRLRRDGRIIAGGRFGAYGLMLVRGVSEEDARSLFASDPTLASGVFVAKFERWYTVFDGTVPRT